MHVLRQRLQNNWLHLLLLVLVIYCTTRFGFLAVRPPGMIPNDYAVYHDTCTRWHEGKLIYNPQDPSPFKYSPAFLVGFCATVYKIGKEPSWPLFAGISIALFAVAMSALLKWAFGGIPPARRLLPVLLPSVVFGWHGLLEQFSYGQIDFLMFVLFVAAALAAERKQLQPLAALFMSLVLITKPQMAIWLGYFLLVGNWRVLGMTVGATLLLLVAPVLVFGRAGFIDVLAQWKHGLSEQSVEFMTGNHNQGLGAVMARLSGSKANVFAYTNLFLAVGTTATVVLTSLLRKGPALTHPRRARAFCWITLLYLLLCPISWRWVTFVWMPIGAIVALDTLQSRKPLALGALGGFVLCGIVLQRIVANSLGIHEVDELSWAGLYAAASFFLLVASTANMRDPQCYTLK